MWSKRLAILGVLLFLLSALIFMAEAIVQALSPLPATTFFWLQDIGRIIIAGAGLFLGPVLMLPWLRERMREQDKWLQKRDEKIDGPPRIPS